VKFGLSNNCLAYCLLAGLFSGFVSAYAQETPATGDTSSGSAAKSDSGSPPPATKDTVFVAPEPVVVVVTATRGPTIGDESAVSTVIGPAEIATDPANAGSGSARRPHHRVTAQR